MVVCKYSLATGLSYGSQLIVALCVNFDWSWRLVLITYPRVVNFYIGALFFFTVVSAAGLCRPILHRNIVALVGIIAAVIQISFWTIFLSNNYDIISFIGWFITEMVIFSAYIISCIIMQIQDWIKECSDVEAQPHELKPLVSGEDP